MKPLLVPFILGDMAVIGPPPAKLAKALAIIAATLHQRFADDPKAKPGISKRSCILCSLAVRDFLDLIGFQDARCEACALTIYGFRSGEEKPFHSVGIVPDVPGPGWSGHLVVTVERHLIDTTLYQCQRPCWPELPGMLAFPILFDFPRAPLAADLRDGDRRLEITYAPLPGNQSWKAAPDAHRYRRAEVVKAMAAKMKGWRE